MQRGDRVALMMPNCAAYVVSFFATVHLGAIVVQINPTYTAAEFQRLLGDSGAEVAIVDASAYGTLLSIVEATAVRTIVVAGSAPASLRAGDVAYGDLVARSDSEPLSVGVNPLKTSLRCSTPAARQAYRRERCSRTPTCWPRSMAPQAC